MDSRRNCGDERMNRSSMTRVERNDIVDRRDTQNRGFIRMRQRAAMLLAIMAFWMALIPTVGYAESKVNSVSIFFETNGFDEEGNPEIDVSVGNGNYSAGDVMRVYEYYEEEDAGIYQSDIQTYVVELHADSGSYFNITKSGNIKLQGAGAEFVKASRKENGSVLIITVKLTRLDSFLEEIGKARWQEMGRGSWEQARGALLYRIRLKNPKGKVSQVETGGLEYDFSPFLQKEGDYHFQVRPVSAEGKTGSWADGGIISISKEQASANEKHYRVDYRLHFTGEEKTPANCTTEYLNVGWQNENGKVWYRNQDASYIQNNWLKEGEEWYYFGGDGYRKEDAYITWGADEYYLGLDGKMLKNGKAPDGRRADENGKLEADIYEKEADISQYGPGVVH